MIHREGTHAINTNSSTIGIGRGGGGFGVGFGSTATTGINQSQLAGIVAPPAQPNFMGAGCVVMVIGFVLMVTIGSNGGSHGRLVLLASIVVGVAITMMKTREWNNGVGLRLMARWRNSFMCTCCGNVRIVDP